MPSSMDLGTIIIGGFILNKPLAATYINCGAVLTVIKTYRYIVYVEIFVIVNCGAGRSGS